MIGCPTRAQWPRKPRGTNEVMVTQRGLRTACGEPIWFRDLVIVNNRAQCDVCAVLNYLMRDFVYPTLAHLQHVREVIDSEEFKQICGIAADSTTRLMRWRIVTTILRRVLFGHIEHHVQSAVPAMLAPLGSRSYLLIDVCSQCAVCIPGSPDQPGFSASRRGGRTAGR